ncbi:MAG: M48 family metallopeptidase, partial [Planctomycetota bacterium]
MSERKQEDAPIAPPTGSIPPIHTSESLETAVTLSAFVIAMMVGLYVLVMLAWGWLTTMFLLALPDRLEDGPIVVDIFWYCLAAIIVIVLIFLIKPLLPLRRKKAPPIELDEAEQPELFAYIRALAKCIDAPEPERVLVDVHANASASFAGGMSPTSGPMTLTVGLPLVGGMTVRQFAGVVAHELGHFSQGSMVKQNIVIGFVSGWMTEVALGEDKFDHVIHRLSVSAPPLVRHIFKLIRLVTNAIRRVFYVVMIVGHLVTRMAARQLEYDADLYMTHTIGSKHFASTMRETIVLGHAGMQAIEDAQRFYRDRRLPNDLPAMVVTRARRMDEKQRKKLISGEDQGEVEAFSTHPLTGNRIDKAMALGSDGLVHEDRPARGLFRDFEKLCQQASENLYKEVIGKEYDPKHLTDSSRLIAEIEATDKARKAAQRFCQSDLLLMLPVFPTYQGLRMPESPKQALADIKEMRERARQMREQAYPLVRKLEEAQDNLMNSRQAYLATQAGFQIRDFRAMGLEAGDAGGLNRVVSDQGRVVDELENQVRTYNADLIKRMELDFALLKHPKVIERLGQERADKINREIEVLVPAGQALSAVQDSMENLRVQGSILAMAVHLLMQGLISYGLIEKIKHTAKETVGEIKDTLRSLATKQYPFAHGDGRVTMAEAVCDKPPDEDSLGDILFVADDMVGRIGEMRERIIGRLCHHAERIEKVMGMKPLPQPEGADALDDLLEKIGVDDSGPVQEDTPSAKGLVGALMVQGVMGVTVLALSGYGVYWLLPKEPSTIADDARTPRVVQRDDKLPRDTGTEPSRLIDRPGQTNRPDRNRPETNRPDPNDRPGVFNRPDSNTPRPDEGPKTIEQALAFMEKPFSRDREKGMRALLDIN